MDVTFVKIRFWSVVVGEKFVLDEAYEEVGVARSIFVLIATPLICLL